MNSFGFVFSPIWVAMINLAHLLGVLLALGAVAGASSRHRVMAVVLLLAAGGWVATVVLSAIIINMPPGTAPPPVLPWAQIVANLPPWAAVVVGVLALWRGRGRVRG